MKNIEKFRDKLLEHVNVCSWYDHCTCVSICTTTCY